jgi:hypothetical protein
MKYLSSGLIAIFLASLMLFPGCKPSRESPTLTRHEQKYPELRKKYVYQSIIRLANIKQDPDFEKLIKDVNKVTLYLAPDGDSTYQISDIRSGLMTEGYEALVDMRTADAQRISLWALEAGADTHYIALIDGADEDVILEVDGLIHVEYLTSLNVADQSSLKNLLQGGF